MHTFTGGKTMLQSMLVEVFSKLKDPGVERLIDRLIFLVRKEFA